MSRRLWQRTADRATSASGNSSLPSDSAVRAPMRRGRHWRLVAVALVIAVGAATLRLFIWPDRGMPARVSAIVMMNGSGDRLDTALDLAWQHRAPFVVISRGSPYFGHGSVCAPSIPHVKVICFDPNPSTTKGEAEFAGRLAGKVPLEVSGTGHHHAPRFTCPPADGALLRRSRLRRDRFASSVGLAVRDRLRMGSDRQSLYFPAKLLMDGPAGWARAVVARRRVLEMGRRRSRVFLAACPGVATARHRVHARR